MRNEENEPLAPESPIRSIAFCPVVVEVEDVTSTCRAMHSPARTLTCAWFVAESSREHRRSQTAGLVLDSRQSTAVQKIKMKVRTRRGAWQAMPHLVVVGIGRPLCWRPAA